MARCRLCTSNDREALVEHVATAMWESRRTGHLEDGPWDGASEYWQDHFRQLAKEALYAIDLEPA